MTYGIITDGKYIYGLIKNANEQTITQDEFENMRNIFKERPTAPTGYQYLLRVDNLEWELAETPYTPDPPDQPTDADKAEAYEILMGVES